MGVRLLFFVLLSACASAQLPTDLRRIEQRLDALSVNQSYLSHEAFNRELDRLEAELNRTTRNRTAEVKQ